ncbi:hypothetical protein NQ315_010811 [Exocentrus adspersus]|uniref:U-box domain-containing protein n=1 Tax=Exocentrus adspersus TaxID=1586481 RepID=A0AAV8V9S5_9CUCU|nr:hypothetical protein NQ315_010811 [Exocentrus adspersus]
MGNGLWATLLNIKGCGNKMFDFLNPKLSPKIVCKSPATDNYEIDNLISDNYVKRMRGFIAYPAIKPPVEIEIKFICPVNIHYITLQTTVGSQKCTGIEIYAKTSKDDYTSICKSVYDNSGVVFCNSKTYSNKNLPPNFKPTYSLGFFKRNTFNFFFNASEIKVVIFRTEKSVPCLGSVEVWGEASRTCSSVTKETINRIMQKSIPETLHCDPIQSNREDESDELKIPDDFKDDLTFELMTIPMTLPSGKTVDQSTLEKHINGEISFGRKPCDPFTGVKFSNTLKPVLNVALKSRIDMFLLQNSHREQLWNLKRTLGGAQRAISSTNYGKRQKKCDELDELILKAKRSATFTSFTNEDNTQKICSKCKVQSDTMYKIPCKHCYCRSCMLQICETLICYSCERTFKKSDINKLNL